MTDDKAKEAAREYNDSYFEYKCTEDWRAIERHIMKLEVNAFCAGVEWTREHEVEPLREALTRIMNAHATNAEGLRAMAQDVLDEDKP